MTHRHDWNNRILIVDDQPEIHQDFEEVLKPSSAASSTKDLAKAFHANVTENFKAMRDFTSFNLPPFELIHAQSGKEAIAKVTEAREAERPIAVAYIDIRMPPGIDGVETTHRSRDNDGVHGLFA